MSDTYCIVFCLTSAEYEVVNSKIADSYITIDKYIERGHEAPCNRVLIRRDIKSYSEAVKLIKGLNSFNYLVFDQMRPMGLSV